MKYLDASFGDVGIFTNDIPLLIDFFCPRINIARCPVIDIIQMSARNRIIFI